MYHNDAKGPRQGPKQHPEKLAKIAVWFRWYPCGQTDRHTDVLIAILCNHSREWSHQWAVLTQVSLTNTIVQSHKGMLSIFPMRKEAKPMR